MNNREIHPIYGKFSGSKRILSVPMRALLCYNDKTARDASGIIPHFRIKSKADLDKWRATTR